MSEISDDIFKGRIRDLSWAAAQKNCFAFSDFLTPAQRSDVLGMRSSLPSGVSFWGGYEDAERVMARFGSVQDLGYEEPYPMVILQISPENEKFCDDMTHRDFLGALLNLGIDRKLTGDILTDGKSAYVFVQDHIASFICDSLERVKHTSVKVCEVSEIPETLFKTPENARVTVPSLRLDAVISKAFNLPRSVVSGLIRQQKVFVNSRMALKDSLFLKEGDLVSVRGHGRFRYLESLHPTKKGNLVILIDKY